MCIRDRNGGGGTDTIYGGDGADNINGGGGGATIYGGDGTDTAKFGSAANTISLANSNAQNTGEGNDTLISIENVEAGAGNDVVIGNDSDNFRRNRHERSGRHDNRTGNNNSGNHSKNDWKCGECQNINFSFRTECNRCGAKKGSRGNPGRKWQGNERRSGDRKQDSSPRPGDWECPQCGKSNFARRTDCFSCGRQKRVGGPRIRGHHRKLKDPPPLHPTKYGRSKRRGDR